MQLTSYGPICSGQKIVKLQDNGVQILGKIKKNKEKKYFLITDLTFEIIHFRAQIKGTLKNIILANSKLELCNFIIRKSNRNRHI